MSLHVKWGPAAQEAVRFKVEMPDPDWRKEPEYRWITQPARRRRWCAKCGRRRELRNMLIYEQAYYDPYYTCKECPPKRRRTRIRR